MSRSHPDYKTASLIDVNNLLSFAKAEYKELEEQIKEEKRVEHELNKFIESIEKHSGHRIHYIGHEKKYGKHLVRFLLKDGGFVEVMVEKPLAINGHFISKKSAEKFVHGLKKALQDVLPESAIKKMMIDSVKVEDGYKDDVVKLETHGIMHNLFVRRTMVMSIVAIVLVLILKVIEEIITIFTEHIIHIPEVASKAVIAIIIALFFDLIKEKADRMVEGMVEK